MKSILLLLLLLLVAALSDVGGSAPALDRVHAIAEAGREVAAASVAAPYSPPVLHPSSAASTPATAALDSKQEQQRQQQQQQRLEQQSQQQQRQRRALAASVTPLAALESDNRSEATAATTAAAATGAAAGASLEALLCRHFDVVFRIASCGSSSDASGGLTHGSVASAAGRLTGNSSAQTAVKRGVHDDGALCLWRFRLQRPASRDGGGGGGDGGGDFSGGAAGGDAGSAEGVAAATAGGGRRRLLRHLVGFLRPDGLIRNADGGFSRGHQTPVQVQEQGQVKGVDHAGEGLGLRWQRRRSRRLQTADPPGTENGGGGGGGGGDSKARRHGRAADTAVLTEQDLLPYNSVWPREAMAYKAHLTALRLCGELLPPGPPPSPPPPPLPPGGSQERSRSCAIITDDVAWVAADDGGALERAFGLPEAGISAAVAAAAAAATGAPKPLLGRRPVFVERDAATLEAAVSALVGAAEQRAQGTANVDDGAETATATAAANVSSLGVLRWGRCLGTVAGGGDGSGGDGGGGGGAAACGGVYGSREQWLGDLAEGLTELQRQATLAAPLAAAAGGGGDDDGDASASGLLAGGVLGTGWDVLALPSVCGGWTVSEPDAAAAARGLRHAGSSGSGDSGGGGGGGDSSERPTGHGAGSHSPPPAATAQPMAGCILAFSAQAAAALTLLAPQRNVSESVTAAATATATATEAATEASTRSGLRPSFALLPVTNTPFFAKLNLLARQGVLSLAVSLPPPPPLPAEPAAEAAAAAATQSAATPEPQQPLPAGSVRAPRRRFLLYTCAGDQGVWRMWAQPGRNYDLLVAYYGARDLDDPRVGGGAATAATAAIATAARNFNDSLPDYIYRAHGSKHQNIHRLHSLHPGLLASYDAVAVWDDDLAATAEHVSTLFKRFAELSGPPGDPYGIWVAQPSLKYGSKVDYVLLANQPQLRLSYTSIVENNACMFRSDKLSQLLDSPTYSGELMGWGVEYAYLAALGSEARDRFAVLHDFQVLNPPGEAKPEGREILKLASQEIRIQQYRSYAARYGIVEVPAVAYKCVPMRADLPPHEYPDYCPEYRPPPPLVLPPLAPSVALDLQFGGEQALRQATLIMRNAVLKAGAGSQPGRRRR